MPRKKKTSKRSSGRAKATPTLKNLSVTDLHDELERRREAAVELAEERAELLDRVAEIDDYLAELGVSTSTGRSRGRPRKASGKATRSHNGGRRRAAKKADKKTSKRSTSRKTASHSGAKKVSVKKPTKPRGSRKRHRNDTNLVEALQQVLSGTTMGVTEAAAAVQAAGYKTTSPNFRTIVNQTLIKHSDAFSKKGRGKYTAK